VKKFKIKSFCKINLSLRVLKKLNNGYHSIKSLITFCNLHDTISIRKIQGTKDYISFSGKFKKGINKKTNTVAKVLFQLRKRNFFTKQMFKINIKKNIPQGSGLGGGSGNAASLLNFFINRMNVKLTNNQIKNISNQIGSDVPVYLKKKNTLLTGKNDAILRLNQSFKLSVLIVYPNVICSTQKIYKKNKVFTPSKPQFSFGKKNKKQLILYLKNEKNDLEKIVVKLYSKVGQVIDVLKSQKGCYFSRITGSGSACIGVFSDMRTAILTQKLIKLKFPKYWSHVSKTM
jgi:4-diphosphocytidyl-2-C-methyl-D-erythritol kinase